jgi:CubicO group peptidase (beta-lactamase class C family)
MGQAISHDAYGKVGDAKATTESIYNIMSMTKPISGKAMMTIL